MDNSRSVEMIELFNFDRIKDEYNRRNFNLKIIESKLYPPKYNEI